MGCAEANESVSAGFSDKSRRTAGHLTLPQNEVNSRIAAERIIEFVLSWPRMKELLRKRAVWESRSQDWEAMERAGIVASGDRFILRSNSQVASQVIRQAMCDLGGIRFANEDGTTWYACLRVSDASWRSAIAVSFGEVIAAFRPGSVGLMAPYSLDSIRAAQAQDLIAALELLVWADRNMTLVRGAAGLSVRTVLAAIGRCRRAPLKELFADVESILAVVRGIRVRQLRLPVDTWRFVIERDEPAAGAYFPVAKRGYIAPSPLMLEFCRTLSI